MVLRLASGSLSFPGMAFCRIQGIELVHYTWEIPVLRVALLQLLKIERVLDTQYIRTCVSCARYTYLRKHFKLSYEQGCEPWLASSNYRSHFTSLHHVKL